MQLEDQTDEKEVLDKIYRYCVYQDRCRQEVEKKLKTLGANPLRIPGIIQHLEAERFLDEARFANSFVRGKFTYKRWGKNKLTYELRQKGVSEDLIEAALIEEIDQEHYEITARKLIERKARQLNATSIVDVRDKLVRFMQQKGFEWETIELSLREAVL
ncbi:MAG: regulatory protein RecX [Bacteroidota bacterium]